MKGQKYFIVALVALALFYFLSSVGGYETGTLSLGGLLARSAGSVGLVWALLSWLDSKEQRKG